MDDRTRETTESMGTPLDNLDGLTEEVEDPAPAGSYSEAAPLS